MKRTLSLILALVLALSCSFMLIACSECDEHVDANYDEICDVCEKNVPYTPEYLGFEGLYNTDYEEYYEKTVYSAATAVEALNDMTQDYYASNSTLTIFKNEDAEAGEKKLAVLNTETGAVVLTLNKEEDEAKITANASLTSYGNEEFIIVKSTNTTDEHKYTYTYKLYTALGAEITSKTNKSQSPIDVNYLGDDLYAIEGKVYEIVDSVATFKYDVTFAEMPDYDYETAKYNYIFVDSEAYVYDKTNKLVASWTLPSKAYNIEFFILSNGNVFIQYITTLPWDATAYDYHSGSTSKYDLTSLIFDVETKTTKTLELDYIVNYVWNPLVDEDFNETFVEGKLHNVVSYNKIVDKMVNNQDDVIADMTDNMFTIGYLAEEIAGQDGFAELIADNRFVVENKAGQKFLLNEKGAAIGDITGTNYMEEYGFIISENFENKAYDLDLNVALDMEALMEDYDQENGGSNYVILSQTAYDAEDNATTTYYLFDYKTTKKLTIPEGVDSFDCYSNYFTYTYENETDSKTYKVYCNVNGDKIAAFETTANSSVVSGGDVLIIRVNETVNETNVVKYYVAK